MTKITNKERISIEIRSWVITVFTIFLSMVGILMALMCIFALPDKSVRPLEGSIFFACVSIVIVGILLYLFKREKIHLMKNIKIIEVNSKPVVFQENISDKIIKWLVTGLSAVFVFWSFMIALICIYALPDNTVQPLAGIFYFFSGSVVLGIFIFVVWRNRDSKK